jgi:hypothetical protein
VLNTPEGLVVVTGCGHAGIINILTFARQEFSNEPVERQSSVDCTSFRRRMSNWIGLPIR